MLVQDIIAEKINTNIRFEYVEDSEGDNNRGWQVDKVVAYLGEHEVGYLKLAYIPAERFKKWYPSILNYIQQINGSIIFPHEYRATHWTEIPIDTLRKSIYSIAQVAGVGWHESNSLQEQAKTAPDKIVRQMIHSFEIDIEKEKGPLFRRFKKYFVNNPYVDYIKVNDEYKRQGIGTALYRAGYEWMKSKGMKLHASGTQSDDAKAAWMSLERNYPVEKIRIGNPHHPHKMVTRRRFA
jgi:GNAT superfamily N-acetyltransferase